MAEQQVPAEQAKPTTGKVPTRSEREAKIKDKAGWVITVLAACLAINTLLGNSNSSRILSNTITANDKWAFYQAKSMKQTMYELASVEALARGDTKHYEEYKANVDRYESDPATGEGKKEIKAAARKLEEERNEARKRSPFFTYAGSLFQISIVLLTASILAVNRKMLFASIFLGSIAIFLMSQAVWFWLPSFTL